MSPIQSYINKYGPVAGPKLYHAIRSRSAYIGANARRRAAIARLTSAPLPHQRPSETVAPREETVGLLPFGPDAGRLVSSASASA